MQYIRDSSVSAGLVGILSLYIVFVITRAVYNILFHPLARFPGPISRTAFAFPGLWSTCKGDYVSDVWAAHQKYGKVVRIAPDALSFSSAQAWNDIYNLQHEKRQLAKDYKRFPDQPGVIPLFGSDDEDHARMRRIIGYGFSSAAVRQQQGLVDEHIETLMRELEAKLGEKVDLNHMVNLFAFDIMSHLTFGESFNSLPTGENHPFTADFFEKIKIFPIIYVSREYTAVNLLLKGMMMIPSVKKQQQEYFEATTALVEKRMTLVGSSQHDFMKYILENNDEKGMSTSEIKGVTTVLLNAGGQETATCIVSTVFYLLKNSRSFQRAREEADTRSSVFIGACVNESLRVHPPVSGNTQRRTGPTGWIIDGYHVPPDTSVGVNQFAACHSPENFTSPEEFMPERWLRDESKSFDQDDTTACQPFAVGPRGCIGKGLALMIANRLLVRLLNKFDLEVCEESKNWDQGQKFNIGWIRPPFLVVMKRRAETPDAA